MFMCVCTYIYINLVGEHEKICVQHHKEWTYFRASLILNTESPALNIKKSSRDIDALDALQERKSVDLKPPRKLREHSTRKHQDSA